jgi:hypothetical protein
MRNYMRQRRGTEEPPAPGEPAVAPSEPAVAVTRPVKSLLAIVKHQPADVWPNDDGKAAETISEKYRRDIRKPKEQKPVFSKDQIIG